MKYRNQRRRPTLVVSGNTGTIVGSLSIYFLFQVPGRATRSVSTDTGTRVAPLTSLFLNFVPSSLPDMLGNMATRVRPPEACFLNFLLNSKFCTALSRFIRL